jgi:hypothetical protein
MAEDRTIPHIYNQSTISVLTPSYILLQFIENQKNKETHYGLTVD